MTTGLKTSCCFLMILSIASIIEASEVKLGTASWYSSKDACRYNPTSACLTASGKSLYELERQKKDFAAWEALDFLGTSPTQPIAATFTMPDDPNLTIPVGWDVSP